MKPLFAPTARAVDQGRSHDAKSAMSALLINNTRSIENQCTVEECHSFSFDQRAHGVLPRRGWTLRVLRNRGPAAAAGSLKRLQTFCQPGDCAVDRRCRPRVHGDDQKQQQWCTMRDDFTAHARRQSRVQHECSHECSHHTTHAAASVVREQFEIIVGRPNIQTCRTEETAVWQEAHQHWLRQLSCDTGLHPLHWGCKCGNFSISRLCL